MAAEIAAISHQGGLNIAHAPWLQNSSLEIDDKTFLIFAARQEQMAHEYRRFSHQFQRPAQKWHLCDAKHDDARRQADWLIDWLMNAPADARSGPMLC